jgi:hypothetical protein
MNPYQSVPSLTQRARQEQERPAPHPFRVGEMYANRRGNYEVVQIAPPKMTIRYDDGELVTADIVILARIWDNMQLPPEQPETGPRQRATTRRTMAQPRAAKTATRSGRAGE